MAGRISAAMERALAHVAQSKNISESARVCEVDVRSLRRALRRAGEAPRATFNPQAAAAARAAPQA